MLQVVSFMFNPFQENTYLLFDETAECVIFDPGCHTAAEQKILKDYIAQNNLTPVRLINTHCHIDHIFGNTFVANKYGLGLEIHKNELPLLEAAVYQGKMWGINVEPSPQPKPFFNRKRHHTIWQHHLRDIVYTRSLARKSVVLLPRSENCDSRRCAFSRKYWTNRPARWQLPNTYLQHPHQIINP
jgi:hypothetical protein